MTTTPVLRFHDSRTGIKQLFAPIDPSNVRVYVCGPTVYDLAHLGNARSNVVFDVLVRLLRCAFPRVTYVRNITDVDDKINDRARQNCESIQALTERTTADFHADMAALGNNRPDIEPRATAHITDMIAMIKRLVCAKHAYEAAGHVLFSVASYPAYGTLSGRVIDDLQAGARIETAPYKRDPTDFVLWKPSDPDLPGWESPWGRGRPGWHIECSAMSWRYLGDSFDIHGGGHDLLFPHHENECAQSLCAFPGSAFARVWLHNGMLLINGEKMSKSLGNFQTLRDVLARAPAEAVRLALLRGHYRAVLEFSDTALSSAHRELDRFYRALAACPADDAAPTEIATTPSFPTNPVFQALADDLNTPLAIAALHQLADRVLAGNAKAAMDMLAGGRLLGLFQQDSASWFQRDTSNNISAAEIEIAIAARTTARRQRDFEEADKIRRYLAENGVVLEDNPNGTHWRRDRATSDRSS